MTIHGWVGGREEDAERRRRRREAEERRSWRWRIDGLLDRMDCVDGMDGMEVADALGGMRWTG